MALTVGSLFSGIDGLGLGLERAGMTVRWQSEIEPYCCRVLAKHWPTVPNLGDVKQIDWSTVEPVDLVCGGYPCQPFSYAGVRQGESDPRHLWPEFARCLCELRPRYALGENVAGHLSLGFDRVLGDLAELGFDVEWSVVPACAMGASHSRPRLFWLANAAGGDGSGEVPCVQIPRDGWPEPRGSSGAESRPGWWLPEPALDRMADGVPRRLVRGPLHALGNAVVPPVSQWLGEQIVAAA